MKRLRIFLLILAALMPFAPVAAHAFATTPTEAAALAAAEQDHTAYALPPDKLAKAETLKQVRVVLGFGAEIWGIVVLVLLLHFRIASRMRNVAVNLSKNRWAQGFTFYLQFLLLTTLLGLPIQLYAEHVRRKYGLSVQGWGGYFGDEAKSFLLSYIVGGLLVMLLFLIIRKFPRRWWLALWFPVMAFVLFGLYISPIVIDPLFNKFEPLAQNNPALAVELAKVAKHGGLDVPAERMFLMKASDKTTQLNAYVTGFGGSKRVVIWDTLAVKMTPDEIAVVCGHEMGHYILGHIVTGMLVTFGGLLVAFFLAFYVSRWLLARFGQQWRIPAQDNWAALVVYLLVLQVFSFVGSPLISGFVRVHEHDADVFGMEAAHGIVTSPQAAGQGAFQVLGENSFVPPDPYAISELWFGTHPPIWLRAAFAKHYDPWAPGASPKYILK